MDKKGKAPAVPREADEPSVSMDDMRRQGLRYTGSAIVAPPGTGRVLPARDLTGPEAAYFVPDRKALLWLLAHGYALAPAPEPDPEAAPEPKEVTPNDD